MIELSQSQDVAWLMNLELTAQLKRLVEQTQRESDPVNVQAITRETWRVLEQRERLKGESAPLRSAEIVLKFHFRHVQTGVAMRQIIKTYWQDERGQDIAEYAVMLAVILVIVVATLRIVGSNANNVFSQTASSTSRLRDFQIASVAAQATGVPARHRLAVTLTLE